MKRDIYQCFETAKDHVLQTSQTKTFHFENNHPNPSHYYNTWKEGNLNQRTGKIHMRLSIQQFEDRWLCAQELSHPTTQLVRVVLFYTYSWVVYSRYISFMDVELFSSAILFHEDEVGRRTGRQSFYTFQFLEILWLWYCPFSRTQTIFLILFFIVFIAVARRPRHHQLL